MRKYLLVIGLLTGLLYSCKVDNICAAYQSYFLLSPQLQPSAFSFQEADSVPEHYVPELFALVDENGLPRKDLPNTEKDKNGLVKGQWDIIKNWNKRIVPREVVLPEEDDSLLFAGDQMMLAEVDVVDSLALDSALASGPTYRYNNDQKFYNWYFRDKLAWADERPQPAEEPAREEKEKKEGFFKRLFSKFKKKDKETVAADSVSNN